MGRAPPTPCLLFEEKEAVIPLNGFAAPAPVFVACALSFILYLGAYMRLPLVPLFASDLGATTVQVGMINAGFMVAAALLSLPLGLVSDRLGRKRLILSGMAISGLTSLFLLLVRTPLQVGAVYLFAGVGLACFSPSMMSYVGDVSPPHFLGRAYGWYTSSLYLGMAAGPGLGGAIADGGFRTAFLFSAAVIAAGILGGGPRTPPPPAGIRIPVGHLADRTGKRERYIVAGNLFFALCIALIGAFRGAVPLYLLFFGIGGGMGAACPAIGAVLSESAPPRVRGLAMGGYNTCIYGGFAVSAATLGAVISRFGFAAGFAVAGGLCALSVGAVVLLFPPSPGPASPDGRR